MPRVTDQIRKMDPSQAIMVKDFLCPECGQCELSPRSQSKPNLVGWCETEWGYMAVLECPHCFTKFRTHAASVDKFDFAEFEYALECWIIGKSIANYKDFDIS